MLTTFIILDALIAIQTLIIIGAAVVLFVTVKRTVRASDAVRRSVLDLLPRVDEIVERVNELAKVSQPIGSRAADISADIQKMVESARDSVVHVTELVNDVSSRAKAQAEKVDAVVTENLNKLDKITTAVTENLAAPMAELSAVLKGGYAAAKYLRRQRASTGAQGDGHEEQAQVL